MDDTGARQLCAEVRTGAWSMIHGDGAAMTAVMFGQKNDLAALLEYFA